MDKRIVASIIVVFLVGIVFGYSVEYFTIQPEIKSLQNEAIQRDNQIQTLQSQVNELNENISQKNNQIQLLEQQASNLNQSYVELTKKYDDLLFHYNLLNAPASNFTTIQNLQITFTTSRTKYYYKDPVSGNATMTYLNGTPFEGSFTVGVAKQGGGSRIGWTFYLQNGFADFNIESPVFSWGPGTYAVKIYYIYTKDGFIVADPNTAGLPEVQVEAK